MTENTVEFELKYDSCNENNGGIPAIIVAAGSSARMHGVNKQFIPLLGIPVLVRTLKVFQHSPLISRIIIAAREDDIPEIQLLCEKYMITKLSDIVKGGCCRQESVRFAVGQLCESEKYVLIHDGARPFADETIITAVVTALKDSKAVCCAIPVRDTVKRTDSNGIVTETVPREGLVSVQTPQGVEITAYKKALELSGDLSCYTDDMSVMENAGFQVKTVPGSVKNIKLTLPEDITLAQAMLLEEENE